VCAFGLAQLFGVGEEHGHFGAGQIGQHAHQIGEVLRDVIGQHPDAEIAQNRLKHAEIIVHRQHRGHIIGQQVLDHHQTCADLRRAAAFLRHGSGCLHRRRREIF